MCNFFNVKIRVVDGPPCKSLQAVSIVTIEAQKDRDDHKRALLAQLEEGWQDREDKKLQVLQDRKLQDVVNLKQCIEDYLFNEKRKVKCLEAKYTYGEKANQGLASYYKTKGEQIEKHEEELKENLRIQLSETHVEVLLNIIGLQL